MNICTARWIASFVCLLCLGIPTYASADAWLLGGSADGEGSIFAAATGERWGFGVGGVFNGDYSEGEVLDYPIPHSSYFDLGEQQVGGLLSLDVLYELMPSEYGSLWISGGFSTYEERQLVRSRATGWIYSQSKSTTVVADAGLYYELGLTDRVGFVAAAHTELGVLGGLTLEF
ncbi:hypothetical protein BA899_01200 [Spiribacter sp. SSL99]|nr:hypothetical protein BA899_01200 [Spiribacter sp. SSL99]